jgi:hypothetical protein
MHLLMDNTNILFDDGPHCFTENCRKISQYVNVSDACMKTTLPRTKTKCCEGRTEESLIFILLPQLDAEIQCSGKNLTAHTFLLMILYDEASKNYV